MMDFVSRIHKHFQDVADSVFSELKAGEDLILNLECEKSLFLRFNANRIRQNTNVEQTELTLQYLADGRTVDHMITLSGNLDTDRATLKRVLQSCRDQAKALPVDPHQVPAENNGESNEEFRGYIPSTEELIQSITGVAEGSDFVGLYCGGPVIRANRNSKGQNHWFASEMQFMDYSLYDGPRAAKNVYASTKWNHNDWKSGHEKAKDSLSYLSRPIQDIKPGKYRAYLTPSAVGKILSMFSWMALSAASWKQGQSPFKRLADGEVKFSPLFTLRENFSLSLHPRFNGNGELSPETLPLIQNGELKSLLVSSRTAKEYGLKSNAADQEEYPRSPEIMPGSLQEKDILRELGTGLYLSNLHYLNWSDRALARVTGMTRYACFWVENGEIVGPIKDLRFDESFYEALGPKLEALTAQSVIDPVIATYIRRSLGGSRVPGMLINDFTFTL